MFTWPQKANRVVALPSYRATHCKRGGPAPRYNSRTAKQPLPPADQPAAAAQAIPAATAAPAPDACAAPAVSRRHAAATLLPGLGAALLAAAGQAVQPPAAAVAATAGGTASPSTSISTSASASFYTQWPYVVPGDILPFLRATATPGDVDSVLAAIDVFAAHYPMYRWGEWVWAQVPGAG